jgi:hypothetical protein
MAAYSPLFATNILLGIYILAYILSIVSWPISQIEWFAFRKTQAILFDQLDIPVAPIAGNLNPI